MGSALFSVLAIALCGAFGALGVLLGLRLGVRSVQRDEDRYATVLQSLESLAGSFRQLKLDWAQYQESLEQVATAIERGRRKAAASLSAAERLEQAREAEESARPLTLAEQRADARRRAGIGLVPMR